MKQATTCSQRPLRLTLKAKAMASIAGLPICIGLLMQPAMAQLVNDAVATGTPDDGVLVDALASETVGVAVPITPANDAASTLSGALGVPNILNVFDNDTLNGAPASPATATVTLAPGSQVPDELTFDPATGAVGIAPDTPAGTYSFVYELCETSNPDNCRTATVDITVEAPEIEATEDTVSGIVGAIGADDAINAFDNDELGGELVDPDAITATVLEEAEPIVPGAPVPVLDPETGLVDIPAGTPAGTYTISYEICEDLNPDNCASAIVTIEVVPSEIDAAQDTPEPVRSGIGGDDIINAFDNDTLNGEPVDPADITATVLTPAANPGVTLDPATGLVSVTPDVPADTYTIEYQICETLNPDNCATSTVTVVVEAPVSSISGTVFYDDNVDDNLNAGEDRAPNWVVEVVRDGEVVATTTTDNEGNYSVEGLLSGEGYSVRFLHPDTGVVFDIIDDITLAPNAASADVNAPIDPSGIVYDSIARTPVAGATLNLLGENGNPLPAACYIDASQANQTTGASGEYRFDIIPGAAAQCPLGETDYTISVAPPAGFSGPSTVIPALNGPFDPTGLAAPVLINPDNSVPTITTPPYYLEFALENGDPDVIFNHIPIDPFLTRGELVVIKTTPRRTASVGDIVTYEITVRNDESAQRANVDVVDILPPGLRYIEGTSLVNGIADEPENDGRRLTWEDQIIPANGSVTYNLALVVGAGVTGGEQVNTGIAQNAPDGADISNRGTAVVTITASAVFDCSELIGKVFEDADRDGYQDENEPGVPGVRLATVNGQLITTDEFGRYHIACAAVPNARLGSNFILKIDERTLPLGWVPTTGNPQSIRLTRGKFGELNFGVAPADETLTNRTDEGE